LRKQSLIGIQQAINKGTSMSTECRAKDPNGCRVHGNPTISSLQAQVDQAAQAGNMNDYLNLRAQVDAAHEMLDSQTASEPKQTTATGLDDATLEAGADAWYDTIKQWHQFTGEETSMEERIMSRSVKRAVKTALVSADQHMLNGEITPAAIESVGNVFFNAYYKGRNPTGTADSPYFRSIGKAVLEATRQAKPTQQ
jgi:hypothetical protein